MICYTSFCPHLPSILYFLACYASFPKTTLPPLRLYHLSFRLPRLRHPADAGQKDIAVVRRDERRLEHSDAFFHYDAHRGLCLCVLPFPALARRPKARAPYRLPL